VLIGVFVMLFVKPRLKRSIEGERMNSRANTVRIGGLIVSETLQKKRDLENKEDKPQLTKTEGRFETYTGEYPTA
jgi:hypothetical protein